MSNNVQSFQTFDIAPSDTPGPSSQQAHSYGDVARFQTYAPTPGDVPGPSSHQTRICGVVQRVTLTNGAMTEESIATDKGRVSEVNPWHGTDSFKATARNQNGTPVHELLPTTLVEIGGVQASIATFVAQGVLHKSADGSYSESPAVAEVAPVDTADTLPLTEQAMAQVNEALAPVDQGSLDGLLATGLGAALGTIDNRTLQHKWTQVSGLGGDEGQAQLAVVVGAYQAQADAALLTRGGIEGADLSAFYAWARKNHRGELHQAMQRQVQGHDVSGYKALADRWMSETPPSLNALKAAGVPTRTHTMGSEVWLRGQWMTPGAAARAGLI